MKPIRIVNDSPYPLPSYETAHSAGMDLRAHLPERLVVEPMGRVMVPTGLRIELEPGFEAQVRPRSGLAWKHGVTVLNTPGTIDADYRGELKVILINLGMNDFVIEPGERIAQLIISRHEHVSWEQVEVLESTSRGEGGFGSTGR